jgi:hypothetical protein
VHAGDAVAACRKHAIFFQAAPCYDDDRQRRCVTRVSALIDIDMLAAGV